MIAFVSIAHAASVSGQVTDEDGAPLEGITVVVYDARLNYATASTGEDGAYSIVSIPEGPYRVRALPDDDAPPVERFLSDTWDFCTSEVVDLDEEAPVAGADFALPLGGTASGRVLDLDGTPIEGASVVVIGASARTSLVSRLATTDAEGRWTAVGLDSEPDVPESYRVWVGATGWPDQYLGPAYTEPEGEVVEVGLGDALDVGDIELLDGIFLSGVVYGPDGPVSDGVVYAYSSSQVLDADIAEDGSWSAAGLPPGEVLFWASADGLATTYYPGADRPTSERLDVPTEGADADVDLTLPAESTLTIELTGEGELDEVSVLLYNSDYTVGRGGPLDEAGIFTIDGLYDGEYSLAVQGRDGGFVDDQLRDEDGDVLSITVAGATTFSAELERSGSVAGRVTDEDGQPVYGAYVYAYPTDGSDPSGVATDAEGRYEIGGLAPGGVTIRASYSHYCDSDAGWTTAWWSESGSVVDEFYATVLGIEAGLTDEDVDVGLARDDDHDEMGDAWERDNGLDPTRDDADEDPDGDGLTNLDEWTIGTDPTVNELGSGRCGCGGGGAAWILPLALLGRIRRHSRG